MNLRDLHTRLRRVAAQKPKDDYYKGQRDLAKEISKDIQRMIAPSNIKRLKDKKPTILARWEILLMLIACWVSGLIAGWIAL